MYRTACRLLSLGTFGLACMPIAGQDVVTLKRSDGHALLATVYEPTSKCRGTVIFSHGAGGSEKGARYFGAGLRTEGWLTIVAGHKESSIEAVRGRMRGLDFKAALESLIVQPEAYEARFMDIGAALALAQSRCAAPFKALAGHSMGAATTLIEAGAVNRLGLRGQDRFDAYIAISPQGPGSIFPPGAWKGIRKPVLTLTGTRDSELSAEWTSRLTPFNDMAPGCKWLGVIDGATHMNLAGGGSSGKTEALAIQMSAAFLDAASRGQADCAPPPVAQGIETKAK